MYYWMLLATAWHRDGTLFRNRKLVTALENGDPLAIAYVAVIVVYVVWSALRKFMR
jgi:hypothetical protein